MPIYVPRELFHAQGVLPVGLMGGRDDLEIIRGDAYYQSYICHIPRSTIELGLNGSLDALDGMLFPAICDVIRNLSGMWQMLFPGKLVRYLDVPQNFDREVGGAFWRHELVELSDALTARGARPYDADALRASIAPYNENRALRPRARTRCRRTRAVEGARPPSSTCCCARASLMPVEDATAMLRDYLRLRRGRRRRAGRSTRRACS